MKTIKSKQCKSRRENTLLTELNHPLILFALRILLDHQRHHWKIAWLKIYWTGNLGLIDCILILKEKTCLRASLVPIWEVTSVYCSALRSFVGQGKETNNADKTYFGLNWNVNLANCPLGAKGLQKDHLASRHKCPPLLGPRDHFQHPHCPLQNITITKIEICYWPLEMVKVGVLKNYTAVLFWIGRSDPRNMEVVWAWIWRMFWYAVLVRILCLTAVINHILPLWKCQRVFVAIPGDL